MELDTTRSPIAGRLRGVSGFVSVFSVPGCGAPRRGTSVWNAATCSSHERHEARFRRVLADGVSLRRMAVIVNAHVVPFLPAFHLAGRSIRKGGDCTPGEIVYCRTL